VQPTAVRRLQEPGLTLARLACGTGALLALEPFAVGLVVRLTSLGHLGAFDVRSDSGWTPASFSAALTQVGLSVGFYQVSRMVLDLLVALCFVLVAALLLWRRSDDGLALLVALVLVQFGAAWETNFDRLSILYPNWTWLFSLDNQLSFALLLAFFFLFPDGHAVPGWMRWGWAAVVPGDGL